jgi:membrane fusion protein, multidrug efflux system
LRVKLNASCSLFVMMLVLFGTNSCGHAPTEQNAGSGNQKRSTDQIPTVAVVAVQSKTLDRKLDLPGELRAFQDVPVHAKVEGYITWIGVDRGSKVKKGDKMITISCPELIEKTKEGESKLSAAESTYRRAQSALQSEKSKLVEANARLDADALTYQRLQQAAQTPGAIAQNEVDMQQKTVESDKARVASVESEVKAAEAVVVAEKHNVQAARDVLQSLLAMQSYLTIKAPFDGVITERNVHEGSIVAVDAARNDLPLVRIQQKDILRLVVAVPEDSIAGTKVGEQISFNVPAYLGKSFKGTIARLGYALDTQTRTMPVELNVVNADGSLEPGMFATVRWQVKRPYTTLFVPSTAVASDLKGTFVNRIEDNVSKRVEVQTGQPMGSMVEISGPLQEGNLVALTATDELKSGTKLVSKIADAKEIEGASKHTAAGGE